MPFRCLCVGLGVEDRHFCTVRDVWGGLDWIVHQNQQASRVASRSAGAQHRIPLTGRGSVPTCLARMLYTA